MALDTTTASNILKYDYRDPVRNVLNSATVLLNFIKKRVKKEEFVGLKAYLPVNTGRNVGTGARAEGATLPAAGNQQYDHLEYNCKHLYGLIRLTGQVISCTKNNVGAFVRAVESEMQGLARDLRAMVNRQLWHDGSSVLTRISGANTTTTIEVQSTKFLQVGEAIDFRTGTTGASKGERTVASITDENTFEASAAPGSALDTGDYVIKTGSRNASGGTYGATLEMWGLEALVAAANPTNCGVSETIGNKTRTGNLWHQANVLANGGTLRDLTLDLMQQALDQADIEADTIPGIILTNHAMKRRYASLLIADKRYPPGGEITLDGGYKALEFCGIPLVADKDASLTNTPQQLNRMYFLSIPSFEYEVGEDWDWMDRDGSVLHLAVGNTGGYTGILDAYEACMFAYLQLAVDRSRANSVLTDLKES